MASSESDNDTERVLDSESSEGELGHSSYVYHAHQYEPLADAGFREEGNGNEATPGHLDDLTPAILEARFEKTVPVEEWCGCDCCRVEHLEGSMEYRCCREVHQAVGKMSFDGSMEDIKCITKHEDYIAMTNGTVLNQVGPLLRHQNGRSYRRTAGQTVNEYKRAVAYRWITRWLCGYLGWDNRRPLPACVYSHIRTSFPSAQLHGYTSVVLPEY